MCVSVGMYVCECEVEIIIICFIVFVVFFPPSDA